jgi:hypothetical protein
MRSVALSAIQKFIDPQSGVPYYYNTCLRTSSWTKPSVLGNDDVDFTPRTQQLLAQPPSGDCCVADLSGTLLLLTVLASSVVPFSLRLLVALDVLVTVVAVSRCDACSSIVKQSRHAVLR